MLIQINSTQYRRIKPHFMSIYSGRWEFLSNGQWLPVNALSAKRFLNCKVIDLNISEATYRQSLTNNLMEFQSA